MLSSPQQDLRSAKLGRQSGCTPPQQSVLSSNWESPGTAPVLSSIWQNSASTSTKLNAEPQHAPMPSADSTQHAVLNHPRISVRDSRQLASPYQAPDVQACGAKPLLHVQSGPQEKQSQSTKNTASVSEHQLPSYSFISLSSPSTWHYQDDERPWKKRLGKVRAAQACNSCRKRKAKCDEGRPECRHCKENGLECAYLELPPQKSQKQVLAITKQLESLKNNVNELVSGLDAQEEKLQKLLNTQNEFSLHLHSIAESRPNSHSHHPAAQRRCDNPQYMHRKHSSSQPLVSDEQNSNMNEHLLEYSMPPKHTTAVHNLMEWPLIQDLIPHDLPMTYVMDAESARDLLPLRGNSKEKGRGHRAGTAPSLASSCSAEDPWRSEDGCSLYTHEFRDDSQAFDESLPNQRHTTGEMPTPESNLVLDPQTVDRYRRSYMDHMHILHPFLDHTVLHDMINTFTQKRNGGWMRPYLAIGTKRKRDMATLSSSPNMCTGTHYQGDYYHQQYPQSMIVEPSMIDAIVLLVLALGAVCEHKKQGSRPVDTIPRQTLSPAYACYSDLPIRLPVSTPETPCSPSVDVDDRTPATTLSSPVKPFENNIGIIPGLTYFAKATKILGELAGDTSIQCIQANLLAGLYMGQLGRPFQSHFYISVACCGCQILLESTEYKRGSQEPKCWRNSLNLAFWSCLQLESDILAELDLPPSGITRYEHRQLQELPMATFTDNTSQSLHAADVLRFYLYQIQLRRTLNDIHSMLYNKIESLESRPSTRLFDVLNENLEEWRKMLGDWDWDDNNHESSDINVARMRAKYYGAKYIIHRPSLQWLLRDSFARKPIDENQPWLQFDPESIFASPARPSEDRESPLAHPRWRPVPMVKNKADSKIDAALLPYAKQCIEAAIRSTTAFDAVPQRSVIITNIFGTAHAQFGNLLVLSATYTSSYPELASLIPKYTLRRLLDRTIGFLDSHKRVSPVLAKDAIILQYVKRRVFAS